MPKIYHIVATAHNGVIGKDNRLPWHFSEDLRFFKKTTTGSTVIMGRKTYESIGKPLPNRTNFVLSRNPALTPVEGVRFFQTMEDAIRAVETENAFIIGGAEIYQRTIHQVDGIYLTRIDADYEGDAHYPEVPDEFEEIEIQGLRDQDPHIEAVFYEKKAEAR